MIPCVLINPNKTLIKSPRCCPSSLIVLYQRTLSRRSVIGRLPGFLNITDIPLPMQSASWCQYGVMSYPIRESQAALRLSLRASPFAASGGLLNVAYWPIVPVQEPRTSGVFFVQGMASPGRLRSFAGIIPEYFSRMT